jgi:hypothetical protein
MILNHKGITKMITVENSDIINVNQTSLKGYITTTQINLEKVFGKPTFYGGDKTTLDWFLQFTITENNEEKYVVATIYDWNSDGVNPHEEFQWHIGGHTYEAAELVTQYYNNNINK